MKTYEVTIHHLETVSIQARTQSEARILASERWGILEKHEETFTQIEEVEAHPKPVTITRRKP